MIISHRGLVAAAHLILFGGSQVDALRTRPKSPRQTPSPPTTTGVPMSYFETEWPGWESPRFPLNEAFSLSYTVSGNVDSVIQQQADVKQLPLFLMWTNASGSETPDSTNTWQVIDIKYVCDNSTGAGSCQWTEGLTGAAELNVALNPESLTEWMTNLGKFFLCFATSMPTAANTQYCESFSPFFDISPPSPSSSPSPSSNVKPPRANPSPTSSLTPFTNTLPVTQTTLIVTSSGSQPSVAPQQSVTVIDGQTFGVSQTTLSMAPTVGATTTIPPTASQTADATPASSKAKSGLSTGAIIGIAIGGFFILLIALLVGFFCFRRSQRKRREMQPEQVLLTNHMHNRSRDMMSEKADSEGPMLASILETRPSSGPYDHLSNSAPYNGPLGPGRISPLPYRNISPLPQRNISPLPQRNPTNATVNTMNTDISRGMSDASGPISPRSTVRGDHDFEEPYHDVPIYGDARHIPQVYEGTLQAPFLSEPGMTDEELTRLEEEERRIDAAIAAAEQGRR